MKPNNANVGLDANIAAHERTADASGGRPTARQARDESPIDDAMIERLVRGFYDRIRADEMLSPIFASKIGDWEPHLQKMFAFWSSVAMKSGAYSGQPMARHLPLPINAAHFDRWLALFEETAVELCPPEAAQRFIMFAHRIAESLELGIAGAHGVLLGRRERFN